MNTENGQDERNTPSAAASEERAQRKVTVSDNRIDSRDFFAGAREITIVHGADTYRLRLTGQNKLILTK